MEPEFDRALKQLLECNGFLLLRVNELKLGHKIGVHFVIMADHVLYGGTPMQTKQALVRLPV